jgi:hypothetical protein
MACGETPNQAAAWPLFASRNGSVFPMVSTLMIGSLNNNAWDFGKRDLTELRETRGFGATS